MKFMLTMLLLIVCRVGVGQAVPPVQFPNGIVVGGPGVMGDAAKNGHVSLSQANTGKDVVTACVKGSACLDLIGGAVTLTDASGGTSPLATKADLAAAIAAFTMPVGSPPVVPPVVTPPALPKEIPSCAAGIVPGSVAFTSATLPPGVLMYAFDVAILGKFYPIVYVCKK